MGRPRRWLCVLIRAVLRDRLKPEDLARHLPLAGRELVDAARYLLLTGGDDPLDAARYLVDPVSNGLRSSSSLRRQPAELRGQVRDDLSRRIAVGLPSQGGSYANVERDQKAGEGARASLATRRLPARETVAFQVGCANGLRLDRKLDGQQACIALVLRRSRRGTHLHLPSRSPWRRHGLFASEAPQPDRASVRIVTSLTTRVSRLVDTFGKESRSTAPGEFALSKDRQRATAP